MSTDFSELDRPLLIAAALRGWRLQRMARLPGQQPVGRLSGGHGADDIVGHGTDMTGQVSYPREAS